MGAGRHRAYSILGTSFGGCGNVAGMRIKIGRPDLGGYAGRFDLPPAAGPFGVTFFGVAGLLFTDGTDAVMTDGFFSRPSLLRVALGRIAPDGRRIDAGLERLGHGSRLHAVAAVHTHFDHVLDSPTVALRTGAALVGGASAANVGRGAGLAEDRLHVVVPGEPRRYGAFTLTFVESAHCPPDRFPGVISAPVVPPVRASAYRCGEAWSILAGHDGGRTALVQGSAGFVPGALDGREADVAFIGVGGLGGCGEAYLRDYWRHTVRAVGARRVVLIHWDDFFRPLDRPLRALPYAGDDLDLTMRVLGGLAGRDGVGLHLPTLWRRSDPWEAACGSSSWST
ncbi:L-ascorbate metabolism protein UlaG (beta-lactamase superfamily) [Actinoplanes xinjiangensis]|uniref:L-ascorbate metabolism protein UlaG (Beta-lactamase superfamily) n=2 Tax=Actinoplanes xinjiangensis TaxID=512350 RepID=A0A316EZL0_9ACTN|nr:L-ascorbate metabolism protein UlaG (beta-lactamase superfamily) [Actinoplanes xinjiangensis]